MTLKSCFARSRQDMLNGLLLIDKPILYTSHDVVDVVRRVLGERRVGHAGTLDPMATGLLIVMVGLSTALFDSLSGHDKCYTGVMTLGFSTETQDTEGVITDIMDSSAVTAEDVQKQFVHFVGTIDQRAPLYSAAKKNGQKGYEAARRGKGDTFSPPVKKVEIKKLELENFLNPEVYFSCCVSRGTYIRSLASDIGDRLGMPTTLTSLRRTSSGRFRVDEALTLAALKKLSPAEISGHLERNLEHFSAGKTQAKVL